MEAVAASRYRRQRGALFRRQIRRRLHHGMRCRRPAPALQGRTERTQADRDSGQHDLAERRLIVVGAELGQTKPVGRQRRQVAQDDLEGFELGKRNDAVRRQVDDDADLSLLAEGHTYSTADVVGRQDSAFGNSIVEEATQGYIERDTGNLWRKHRNGKVIRGREKRWLAT